MRTALELYEQALASFEDPLRVHRTLEVRFDDGDRTPLQLPRFLAAADPDDHELLRGVTGPVLDVGCGPGRHLSALHLRGVDGLGVDVSPRAVALAGRHGAAAIVADIFGEVPDAGRWATILLLDGNIGIGGRPERLLRRAADLLAPGGTILVELDAPHTDTRSAHARIETHGEASNWFAWARVSTHTIGNLALLAGLDIEARWQCGERFFARLTAPRVG